MRIHRREFLEQGMRAVLTAGGMGAVSACSRPAARPASPAGLPIVDTHQHLWDLDRFRLSWIDNAPPELARNYVIRDYLKATEGLNVVQAVYMEVHMVPAHHQAEARYVIELCENPNLPTAAAVISGRPEEYDAFKAHVASFKDSPYVKGVRRILHDDDVPAGLCLEPQFVRSVQHLGEHGLSFDICIRPAELGDAVKLVDQCPDTRFIIDHCGNADPKAFMPTSRLARDEKPWHNAESWKRDMSSLAQRKNVICKVSGVVVRARKGNWVVGDLAPPINHCLDEFGPDRVVFGGDWPVVRLVATFKEWVTALKQVVSDRPLEEQQKLFHDNAVRLYGLRPQLAMRE